MMKLSWTLLVATLLITLSHSQTRYCNITDPQTLEIGKTAGICIRFDITYDDVTTPNITNDTTTQYTYGFFRIQVDRLSSIQATGYQTIITDAAANNDNVVVTMQVQFQNSQVSRDIVIFKEASKSQRSISSVVINLVSGGISSIVMDSVCDSGETQCFNSWSSAFEGDPVIYVSWAGSDANNDEMISQAMRPSRFSLYSVGSIYQSLKASADQ